MVQANEESTLDREGSNSYLSLRSVMVSLFLVLFHRDAVCKEEDKSSSSKSPKPVTVGAIGGSVRLAELNPAPMVLAEEE